MRNFSLLFVLFWCSTSTTTGQTEPDFFGLVEEIQTLVEQAQANKDPEAYLKAAKILRKNPTIRPLFKADSSEKDYFNPFTLLELAAPLSESKSQRNRILKERARLLRVEQPFNAMEIGENEMRVPGASNIFITSNQSKSRSFALKNTQELEIRFKEGEKIGIEILDISSNETVESVKEDKSERREKIIRFEAKANRRYQVVMNNDFPNADDFTLAIIVVK